MLETWRLLDTGLASAARNIALSRALLEARDADEIPSTLRFLRFTASVLLGSGQSVHQELDAAWCAAQGIAVQRRISGGRTVYAGERELGWELCLHRRELGDAGIQSVAKRVTHAAATALAALGIDARYRARDEIEIDGRVVAVTAHAVEERAVLFQSIVMMDPDAATVRGSLRGPDWADNAASLKAALARFPDVAHIKRNLAEAFESEFGVEFREGEFTLSEHARYEKALREIDTRGWIELVSRPVSDMPLLQASRPVRNGTLRAALKYECSAKTIREVWFSGDVSVEPRRALNDLEAALRDLPMSRLVRQVESFFASQPIAVIGVDPQDVIAAVRLAIGEPLAA